MINHRESLSQGSMDNFANYGGEVIPDNYLILLGRNRDSDCLEESNFESALKSLGGESESVRIDRIGHWACGWIEYLSIDSNNHEILAIAEDIESSIADYPVLDETDFCEREQEAANDVWQSCYSEQERIEYIRDYRDQFEFYSWSAIRDVVRGEYFNGYASELIQ